MDIVGVEGVLRLDPKKLSLRSNAWLSDLLSLVVQSHVMNSSPFGQSSERVNASAGG